MIDEDILSIIACPNCKKGLKLDDNSLICKKCNKKYDIENGTPVLL